MRCFAVAGGTCPLVSLDHIGYAAGVEDTAFGPGRRNKYIVHYVLSGRGTFNGREVAAGQGFFVKPGMPEHYGAAAEEPWEYVWFMSGDRRLEPLFETIDAAGGIFRPADVTAACKAKGYIFSVKNGTRDPYEMLEIFVSLYRSLPRKDTADRYVSAPEAYLSAAEKYIEVNIAGRITVEELASFVGISQPYLFRLFKERYGLSPKQYIDARKMDAAKELLRRTDLTVTEVAASVGFRDVLHFSRFFSGREGISPSEYRRIKARQKTEDTHG
ncbi:MAG: AraC family transcriptional regulator [Clostridia bacterium]|nr:AraC family transcriptional regulator [Clostridia bacterium]